jgi:GT2 family glycosyltransferase
MKMAGIVVDWGLPDDTLRALQSLAAMRPALDLLIRVDNGSRGLGVEPLKDGVPDGAMLIDLPTNIGWPAAVNVGMEAALEHGAEWTLILNNDATVSPGCLSRCIEEAERNKKVAVVGPAVAFYDEPDKLWFAGGEVNPWFAYTRHRGLMQPSSTPPASSKTGFISGCCFIVSSAAWRQVGPFRSDYFAYYEDAEWCQRAQSMGWQCWYVGEVLCLHRVSVTWSKPGSLGLSAGMAYYLARNPLRFALDTRPPLRRMGRILGIMTIWNAYNVWRILRSRDGRVWRAYLQGLRDAFRGRMGKRPG